VCVGAAALALLLRRPRGGLPPELRRRRLLITSTAAGLLPLLALSVGPELVWGAPLVDSIWTLPALALLPLGYADGLPRAATGRAEVAIGGSRHPVVGRIAMDQCVVDVGDAPVAVGDRVVAFGDPATGAPSAEDWAHAAGTIGYEIVTRIGPRVPRVPA